MGATEHGWPGLLGHLRARGAGEGVLRPRTRPVSHQSPGQLCLHGPEHPSHPEQDLGCSGAPDITLGLPRTSSKAILCLVKPKTSSKARSYLW